MVLGMKTPLEVLIVGAGLGGLTLANALRRALPLATVQVVERDPALDARPQGYGIGLRSGAGLRVLDAIGLGEEARRVGVPARAFRLTSAQGEPLLTLSAPPSSPQFTLSLSRSWLRSHLLSALPGDAVQWGRKAVRYRREGTRAVVQFEDGGEQGADLVVACDGASSELRQCIVGDGPRPLGVAMIGAVVENPVAHPWIEDGGYMALGDGASVFVQSYGPGRALWSYGFQSPPGALRGVAPEALFARARSGLRGWHAPTEALLEQTRPGDVVWRDYVDRDPLKKARDGNVVLMGDAAHPMTPFRGMGANLAMEDALLLAERLATGDGLEPSLAAFEREMLRRSRGAVLTSRKAAIDYHRRGKLQTGLRNFGLKAAGALLQLALAGEARRQRQR